MEADNLSLSWLHCNECQRSFEHHTRLSVGPSLSGGLPGDLQVMRCDLVFSFTSCGHFFCKTCRLQHSNLNFLYNILKANFSYI